MAQHLTRSRDTCLDLVANEENVVLVAKRADLFQVVVIRYYNTGLSLYGLNEERSSVLAMCLEYFP